jgi:hypothetical protein
MSAADPLLADGHEAAKISVVVKPTAAGGTVRYTLDVLASAQVSELKALLMEHANIPVPEQRLIYKGSILKDERTLESYGGLVVFKVTGAVSSRLVACVYGVRAEVLRCSTLKEVLDGQWHAAKLLCSAPQRLLAGLSLPRRPCVPLNRASKPVLEPGLRIAKQMGHRRNS